MDYKYIEQLLERYWSGETSLEEENILRAFFSQKDIPASLLPYRDIFVYQAVSKSEEVLDSDFDDKILALIDEPEVVKARTITLRQRLAPMFKAAAVVAIMLTLGNAIQVPFNEEQAQPEVNMAEYARPQKGLSVAKVDSAKTDTLPKIAPEQGPVLLK
ncbi:MAG: pyruvate ferredoxin oxidoreductase [Prevotella sp.]|jgi:hypothetical protein|nr:pyruvate ferredoxin oxidoreductase [Prevotella sp.]